MTFRRDIEGLRAVAVLMVLFYHLELPWASGGFAGVDVFFVISGFLITGLLVKEFDSTGSISLTNFYARRAKRLLPAAALVLIATASLTLACLPRTRWGDIGTDVVASAAYFVNWWLARRSVDYLAEDVVSSPVQHYWSLAVEEQYYVVWPILLALALAIGARHLGIRTASWLALASVALPSLVWSLYLTYSDPATAYFVTTTRMWELAIGGAVALATGFWRRIPAGIAAGVAWAGLAAIVITLLYFAPGDTAWPGYAAALPTVGAAAVIVGGFTAGARGPVWVLGTPPMCWLGALSYSIYLWHWPLIEIARVGVEKLTAVSALACMAASIALAWLTWKLVENPVRFSRTISSSPRLVISLGLNLSFAGVIAGLIVLHLASESHIARGVPAAPGAAILAPLPRDNDAGAPVDAVEWMTPLPTQATRDIPEYYNIKGCHVRSAESEPASCAFGRADAGFTVAIVGDSKIAQWTSAIRMLAETHDWQVILHTKSSCGFQSALLGRDGKPYRSCYEWNRKVLARLLGPDKPDVVLTSQGRRTAGAPDSSEEKLVAALVDWWRRLDEAGVKVIALADNPHPGMKVYECVSENANRLATCSFPRSEGRGTRALRTAAQLMGSVGFVDMTDWICPTERCAPIIGNVLVYRQGSHITRTYIESMAPFLEDELRKAGFP